MNLNETHTYREIMQQAALWGGITAPLNEVKTAFKTLLEEKKKKGHVKVYFSGAGTSAYIGDVLSKLLKSTDEVSYHSTPTTDIVTEPGYYFEKDDNIILFSFARSGNSPETKGTVTVSNMINDNISHIFITNNKAGYLAKYEDTALKVILPEATNDRSLAMTSSFSTMLISAAFLFDITLSDRFKNQLSTIFSNLEVFTNQVLNDDFKKIFYVATGAIAEMTREISLKMNELTGGAVDVNRETTLGFRHGPKAALTKEALFVQLYSNETDTYIHQYERDITTEVTAFDHYYKVILTPDKRLLPEAPGGSYTVFETGTGHSAFELSLIYLAFGQMLACRKSFISGINPDAPSPDGFINRVVEGVTLYDYEA